MAEICDGDDLIVERGSSLFGDETIDVTTDEIINENIDDENSGESSEDEETEADNDLSAGVEKEYVQSELEIAAASNEPSKAPVITVVYVNEERVEIPRSDLILTDILTRVNFPLRPPEVGMRLDMKVNGFPAEFTSSLKHGDSVTLNWVV